MKKKAIFLAFSMILGILSGCSKQPIASCGGGVIAYSGYSNLGFYNIETGATQNVEYQRNRITTGSLSHNGKMLVFTDLFQSGLFSYDLVLNQTSTLIDEKRATNAILPEWSQNDEVIAFSNGSLESDYLLSYFAIGTPEVLYTIEDLPYFGEERPIGWISDNEVLFTLETKEEKSDNSGESPSWDNWSYTSYVIIYNTINRSFRVIYSAKAKNLEGVLSSDKKRVFLTSGDLPQALLIDLRSEKVSDFPILSSESYVFGWSPNGNCVGYVHEGKPFAYSFITKSSFEIPINDSKNENIYLDWGNSY